MLPSPSLRKLHLASPRNLRSCEGYLLLTLLALVVTVTLVAPTRAAAQDLGGIRGRVVAPSRAALAALTVLLDDGTRRTSVDSAGRFVFSAVPTGTHAVRVVTREREVAMKSVDVIAREFSDVSIAMDGAAQPLTPVVVAAARPLHVVGHMPQEQAGVIYAGKKTEVLIMDSLQANLAQDVERQILGRIPGATFSETEGAGFPSNGVGFRGLNPTQSVEVNTRQNGVSIAGDLFGYPETYYTPPSEALERIEVVRGAGSLAFGPQFGGAVNYVTRRGELNTPLTASSALTSGSGGLVNAFVSLSAGTGAWSFYSFAHGRSSQGQRPHSDLAQYTLFANATWRASERLSLGVELSTHDNRLHMPGGLSDSAFAADPWSSSRSRNWLASPWTIVSARAAWWMSEHTRLDVTLSHLDGDRHLVWRNEDGGAGAADGIDPLTGRYVAREVERETMANTTIEARLRTEGALLGATHIVAAGVRLGTNRMERFAGGPGSTGADFDMRLYGGGWETDLQFVTRNAAVFIEDAMRIGERLTVVPGIRLEYLRSTAEGRTDVATTFAPREYVLPLAGLGAEFALTESSLLYATVSQAYRPVLYASLTPIGSIARVDPALRAAQGYNADIGWRGRAGDALKFDIGAFYLSYRDRIGTRTVAGATGNVDEVANIGTSEHRGLEAYVEIDPVTLLAPGSMRRGAAILFTSAAIVDARYVSGEFTGNRVEQAPRLVQRVGLTLQRGRLASTLQVSVTSGSYGTANNDVLPAVDNGASGFVPAHTVLDLSVRAPLARGLIVMAGVNNLLNARYFTKRTDEYPGPGILPGLGRSAYVGISMGR